MSDTNNVESEQAKPVAGPIILDGLRRLPVKMLLYGDPGVGKTRFVATAPRPLLIEVDPEGELSIASSGMFAFIVRSMKDLRVAWDWLWKNQDQFETVAIDSLTNLQRLGIDEIIDPSELDVGKREWGYSFRQMRGLIMGLTTLPKHVIFICSQRLREDKSRGLQIAVPNVTPSVANLLNDYCRVVGRMTVKWEQVGEVNRLISQITVFNSGRFWGKDTSGRLPHTLKGNQVSFTWILNQINEKEKSKP